MIPANALKIPTVVAAGLMIAVEVLIPRVASAQTVTMNEAMLARCDAEGLAAETCACWFAAIAESEGMDSLTEEDVDALAPAYQEDLQACIEANEGYSEEYEE